MSRRKTLLLLMLLICSVAYPIPFLSAEMYTPLLRVTANDIYLTAGEENQIEIEIKNTGDFSVYEVEAILSVPATTLGISVIDQAHKIFNEIDGGKTKRYHPIIYVDRDTPLGAYTLTYQVDYRKMYKLGYAQDHSITLQLGVVVKNVSRPHLQVNVEVLDPHLTAGTEKEINVALENIGRKTIYEIDATIISPSSGVAVLKGVRFTRSSLEPNTSVAFQPTIAVSRSAPLGVYTLTASVSYEDGDGQSYLDTFTLGVNVESMAVEKQTSVVLRRFEVTPGTVRPGDILDLRLELALIGAEAHDVKTLISFGPGSSLSPLSTTLVPLGDLDPGQTAASSYRLLVDGGAASGQYPVSVTISYLDSDGASNSVVETVIVSVRGIVSFRLLNTPEVVVEQGDIFDLEVDLLLVGTESVKFVQVDVVEADPFEGTLESYEYIGPVDPDSPIPFDIGFAVGADAEPGGYILLLNVTYFDDLNRVRGSIIELPVSVVEARVEVEVRRSPLEGFWLWLRRLLGVLP